MEQNCRAGQATDINMAHEHCMLGTLGYRDTLRICNTYSFSTATMVARTRLSVTLFFTADHIDYFTTALSSAVADQQGKMSNYKCHHVNKIQSA
jgi:hypothetical protein